MYPQFVRPFIAKVALLKHQAVILDTSVRGQVDLPGGANAYIIGFAINDAAAGQEVAVQLPGPVVKAIAGDNSFTIGDFVMGEGADGKLKKYTADNTLQIACGISLDDPDAENDVVEIVQCAFFAETALA